MKIKLPYKRVGLSELENILIDHWSRSIAPSTKKVQFNFSLVEYIDLPQICFLLLWIESLLSNGKNVELSFYDSKANHFKTSKVFSIIRNYGFFTCLSQYKGLTVLPAVNEHISFDKFSQIEETALVHLTSFQSKSHLLEFIATIDPNVPNPNLRLAVSDRELLSRSGVRDVFLKELGMNVFDHAAEVPALLAVSRKTGDHLSYSGNPNPISKFARTRKAQEYIQVVVADFGVGIPKTLKTIFETDVCAHTQLDPQLETSIVEYAFWKDITSKPRRAFDELLEQDEVFEYLIPPTGLYFVWNLVKKYKSFLYVRTGKSIWGLDCSSGNETAIVKVEDWRSRNSIKGPIVELPGTLVVVYIPIDTQKKWRQLVLENVSSDNTAVIFKEFINVESILLDTIKADEKTQAIILLEKIRQYSIKLQGNQALLIDCEGWKISTKYIYKLLLYAMYIQKQSSFIVFADFSPHQELALAVQEISRVVSRKKHLFAVFHYDGETKSVEVIGSTENSNTFFRDNRNLLLNPHQIDAALKKGRINLLETKIKSHYHENEKVFLPSKRYIAGYFELADLFGHPYVTRKIAEQLVAKLPYKNDLCIVATAGNLNRLAFEVASYVNVPSDSVFIVKGEVGRPISDIPGILTCLGKIPGSSLLILADVIVTGQSVLKIAETFDCATIIASIVDASGSNLKESKNVIKAVSVLQHLFENYSERPAKWKYEEISLVDPVTHKLIRSGPLQADTLLESEKHLKTWITEERAIRSGHYYYSDVHVNYFFHTYSICDRFQNLFMETIRSDIKKILNHGSSISHVFYPEQNQAAEKICVSLQTHLGGRLLFLPRFSNSERTVYSTATSNLRVENAKTMVFVDTAATTSQTLQYAMEMASEYEADKLLLYIIINRISGRWPAAFEHVYNYRGVEVRIKSLVRVHLPAYTANECPLCKRRIQIENYCNQSIPNNLRNLLRAESKDLMPRSIKELRLGEANTSYDEKAIR